MQRFLWVLVVAGWVAGTASTVSAETGFYLGIAARYSTIKGDFEGNSVLSRTEGSEDAIFLPEIDGAFGVGLVFGYLFDEKWAFEADYSSARHQGDREGIGSKVNHRLVSAALKYHFTKRKEFQPFFLFGFGLNTLEIENGSVTGGEVGDARLSGLGLNIGAGIHRPMTSRIFATAALIYHIVRYDSAEGGAGSGRIDDLVSGNGFSLRLGAAYRF